MLQKRHPGIIKMFQSRLDQIIDLNHPLAKPANEIDWSYFEEEFKKYYSDNQGRPSKTTRLIAGLHYLKYTFNESDESNYLSIPIGNTFVDLNIFSTDCLFILQ